MSIKNITSIGYIRKEEKLVNVNYSIIPKTFVLENSEPFPGYHGENLPNDNKPDSIFFVLEDDLSPEKIVRISNKIVKYFPNKSIDGAPAWIKYYNKGYPAIRIHNINSYDEIKDLQTCYLDEGVKFRKLKTLEHKALIKVQKFFSLEKASDNIFFDTNNSNMAYLQIPVYLNWKLFEKITEKVKNNLINSNFDAATSAIFYQTSMLEFIRIFKKDLSIETVKPINDKYIDLMKEYI